jgi:hypothetical protein
MSGLKKHTEQFRSDEIRFALLSPKITAALIDELTTRIDLFEQFGRLLSVEFGNRLIDEMRQQRQADSVIHERGDQ